jgi:uncharacterized protein (TIGR00299 family) protein
MSLCLLTEAPMRIAYGDLISGISGDMMVGALLDLGLPLRRLRADLKTIPRLKFRLRSGKKSVHGLSARYFQVRCPENQPERTWKEIRSLLGRSSLSPAVKEQSLEIFRRLAEAEAKIHGVAVDDVHFHEIGATDSIVDIVATAIGIEYLEIDSLVFSPLPLGRGMTRSRHGPLPLPGPAALELMKGLPVAGVDLSAETVTPTGAAIVAALASAFGEIPPMTVEKIAYGAGRKEFPDRPNVLRLVLGQSSSAWRSDEMLMLETNIDDMNPEIYDYLFERLFTAGARDVFLQPIQMKKNRPGTLLRVLAEPADKDRLARIVFQETSTIGMRYYPVRRMVLNRATKRLKTKFGEVRIKLIEAPDGQLRATPEYEDLKRIARRENVPLQLLYDEVTRGFTPPARKKRR